MKHFAAALLSLAVLAGCQEDDKPAAYTETSPGGIEYVRLFIPAAKDVAIQLAWPSDWAFRDDVNQAVPYIGTDLILAGGAEGYPAGEVIETFADLQAEGAMWVTPDHLHGELIVARENLSKAVEIAHAHLATPTLDQGWFDRIQQGIAANVAEGNAQPASRGFGALRWAILGDTPLRRALSIDPPEEIMAATRDDVREWHRLTIVRTGAKIVIAGEIGADAAGTTVDTLLAGLPEASVAVKPEPKANFAPRRILLHLPEAQTSTLVLMGPLPPTRDGGEFEDILLAEALGGDDKSVLFDAVRTGLRASYGFGAGLDAFARDLRFLALSGELETAKLAEAETIVRTAYAAFVNSPSIGDLSARKSPFVTNGEQTAKDPIAASFTAMMALFDGQDPYIALTLPAMMEKVTDATLWSRAASAFPAADQLIILAVSPDAEALPGACVITTPEQAVNCR